VKDFWPKNRPLGTRDLLASQVRVTHCVGFGFIAGAHIPTDLRPWLVAYRPLRGLFPAKFDIWAFVLRHSFVILVSTFDISTTV
jgi:hypothetical protein